MTQRLGRSFPIQARQRNTGTFSSSPHCNCIRKPQLLHKTTQKAGNRHFRTFCLYFSIASLSFTNTEDGDTPLALIHPKPHGSSTFLTIFIDILMGPPLLYRRTKRNYLLACVTDGQKSVLTSHSRSISTFMW